MTEKPITDKELEQWKTMCEKPSLIEKEFTKPDADPSDPWPIHIRQQMARAKIGFVAETAMPRLIAEVERLRREIERLDLAYWQMTLLYHNVKDELYGRGD